MKREDLKALGLEKETIDSIMKMNGEDLKGLQDKLKTQEDSIDELNKKLQSYDGVDIEGLKKEAKDWKKKYETDMLAKDKAHARDKMFESIKFSSASAKKAVISEFDSKDLEFKDGTFSGFDKFIEDMKKSDPDAFATDKPNGNDPDYVPGGEGRQGGNTTFSLGSALHEHYKQ